MKRKSIFGQNRGLSPQENDHFFRPFQTLVFWSKIYSFLSRIPRNDRFEHNYFKKSLNFGQSHGLTFQEKIDFLALHRRLPFWSKNHSFLSKISKSIFSDLIIPKNPNEKKFYFWAKTEDYPLRKLTIIFDLLKLQFSGLKFILFDPEYQETIFPNIITSKTLIRNSLTFGPKPWNNLLGKDRFFGAPENVNFLV